MQTGSMRILVFPRFVITNNIFNAFLVMKYKWCVALMSALQRGEGSNGRGCFSNTNKADLCVHSDFRGAANLTALILN